jgi:hypothetical protein
VSGDCNDAIANFALHHEHRAIERGVTGGEPEQNLRSDSVGQVAHDSQPLAGGRSGCGKIEVQDVLLDNGDLVGREARAKAGRQLAIELDSDKPAGSRRQGSGKSSAARPDFDHGAARYRSQGAGDPLDGIGIIEKVLAELGFDGHCCLDGRPTPASRM